MNLEELYAIRQIIIEDSLGNDLLEEIDKEIEEVTKYASKQYKNKKENNKKEKLNRYVRKRLTQLKLEEKFKNRKTPWWTIQDKGEYFQRIYVQSKKIRKISNKRVRKYKGELISASAYRKVYDYWWTIF